MSPAMDYFTDQDGTILGSAQSDPMGLGVIWTGFAAKLFRTRVNSIVNDVRAYTVNLFHHYMVYRIRAKRDAKWWVPPTRKKFQEGEAPEFSRMMLVNLEKILLWAFCADGYDKHKETGLIGLANARNALERFGIQGYKFVLDHSKGEVLSRQAQLGFSGRYRTPFTVHLELLDPRSGHPWEFAERWTEIDELFQSHTDFRKLAQALETSLCGILSKSADEFTVRSLDESIGALEVRCFGDVEELLSAFGPFWMERLGLHEGETSWLWKALPEDPGTPWMEPRDLYLNALALAQQQGSGPSSGILQMIVELEPFLGRLALIFEGLLQVQNQTFELAVAWVQGRYGQYPLREVSPPDPGSLIAALDGEGKTRLRQILEFTDLDAQELVVQIVGYHKGVSDYRKSEPWVQWVEGSWRRNLILKDADPSEPDPLWVHGYYAGSFLAVAQAIRRGVAS